MVARPLRIIAALVVTRAAVGALLLVAVLAFAPGSPAIRVVSADDCITYDCYTVTIATTGGGSGRIQSTNDQFVPDGKIDCRMVLGVVDPSKCTYKFADTDGTLGVIVYMRADPDPGSELCDANGCTTGTRKRSRSFTANGTFDEAFNLLVLNINVAKAGAGSGTVTTDPPYINCGDSCETSLEYGATLAVIATPAAGSRFSKWSGACAGQGATCHITLTENMTATATFVLRATATVVPSAEPSAEPTAPPTEVPTPTIAPTPTEAPATPVVTLVPTAEPTAAPAPIAETGPDLGVILLGGLAVLLTAGVVGFAVYWLAARRAPRSGGPAPGG